MVRRRFKLSYKQEMLKTVGGGRGSNAIRCVGDNEGWEEEMNEKLKDYSSIL